jgi:prepilin-type N-terminal cleavage/methylation domain-containing protein
MKNYQQGMSLIEALISILLLSIALIGANMMQLKLLAATQLSRQRAEALSLASNKIELLRDAGVCVASTSNPITPFQGSASYIIKVTCADSASPSIIVTWSDARSTTNNVRLQTSL